jgi:hypothetical protein
MTIFKLKQEVNKISNSIVKLCRTSFVDKDFINFSDTKVCLSLNIFIIIKRVVEKF